MTYTLAVIDVQTRAYDNLADADCKKLRVGVAKQVKQAVKDGVGVIVCERDTAKHGETCSFVMDLLKDYTRHLVFEHVESGVGDEVMSIIRQRGYDKNMIYLCGIGNLTASAERCTYITNFQNAAAVVAEATVDWRGFR
jgi:hypothetical protein